MAAIITRRQGLALGSAALAAAGFAERAWGQDIPRADVTPPSLPIESGASIRLIRPVRFVEPDEVMFRKIGEEFTRKFNVPVRMDFVGWEDIRAQTAVAANTGAGPDLVVGWGDDPHIFADKLIELTDIADYLGKRYGGWMFLAEKYGKKVRTNNWIGIPMGGSTGPVVYRISAVRAAGFDKIPTDHAGFLALMKKLKEMGKPGGMALGNAVGDGNGHANWLLWSHGGAMVDEDSKVTINSRETLESLNYLRELYPNYVPGTLSWLDPSNNRAYASQECWLTSNGVSLYFALKNDPGTRAIADDTDHAPMPKGSITSIPQSATVINAMVFRHTRFPNACKAFIQFAMESEQYDPWLSACLGYWSHPLKAYSQSKVWESDPKITIYRDGMNNPFWSGYKGPITQASGTVAAEYIMVQMYASVASGQASPQDAVREAERRIRRYYR
ncbi:MAG: carbohydrate ABC transporter substrate-binding protein [Acetobacteraceae bacterium]|nr:carbohydrate ABC transporter substrate-binding protein [Acetobacteraceae bacterium]